MQGPVPPTLAERQRIDIPALPVGPRPKVILDAHVSDTHAFHQDPGTEDRWVCLEGRVVRSGTTMGAESITFQCPACDEIIYCEGASLARYNIPWNTNVMIRGRFSGGMNLSDVDVVTQQQVDSALKQEASSDSK